MVRTLGNPVRVLPFLRAAVLELDPAMPLDDVATMERRLEASVAGPRFYALVVALFSGLALTLATVGIFTYIVSH